MRLHLERGVEFHVGQWHHYLLGWTRKVLT
jgi:hypothetical protein